MTEKIESQQVPLPQRSTPIQDEVLESCLLQVNLGEKNPKPYPAFEVYSLDKIREWAKVGVTCAVAAAISQKQIPDWFAKRALATALEIELGEILANPAYNKNHEGLQALIRSKRVMIGRLRFME